MKLVIADDHKGLRAAARRVFNATPPEVPHSLDEERPGPRSGQTAHGGGGDAYDDLRPGDPRPMPSSNGASSPTRRGKNQPKLGALLDASRDDVLAYMFLFPASTGRRSRPPMRSNG